MIAFYIVNINGDIKGICRYSVRIGSEEICQFEHNRPDGLAVCLDKAAEAVRKNEQEGALLYWAALHETSSEAIW